jgi:hypothetical protein
MTSHCESSRIWTFPVERAPGPGETCPDGAETCMLPDPADRLDRRINEVQVSLERLLKQIRALPSLSGRSERDTAAVFVSSYPKFLPATMSADCKRLSYEITSAEAQFMRSKIDEMSSAVGRAADAAGVNYVNPVNAFESSNPCQDPPVPPASEAANYIILASPVRQKCGFVFSPDNTDKKS